jgi:hypothetical protein
VASASTPGDGRGRGAFAGAAGGIVASRLLCSSAMPYEQEIIELVRDTAT